MLKIYDTSGRQKSALRQKPALSCDTFQASNPPSWALSPTHTAVQSLIYLPLIFQLHIRSGPLVMWWSQETTQELIGTRLTIWPRRRAAWAKYYHSHGFIGAWGRPTHQKRKQSWRIWCKTVRTMCVRVSSKRTQSNSAKRDKQHHSTRVNMMVNYLQNLESTLRRLDAELGLTYKNALQLH